MHVVPEFQAITQFLVFLFQSANLVTTRLIDRVHLRLMVP